jgi:ribosome-binding protein aMBF1 (putative translation factor)
MPTTNNKEKLDRLISAKPSKWEEKAKWRQENSAWLKKSSLIALKIAGALRKKGISQKALSETMGTSPQNINKLLSGKENLTLETISKIEALLGIELVSVVTHAVTTPVIKTGLLIPKRQLTQIMGSKSRRPLRQHAIYGDKQLATA